MQRQQRRRTHPFDMDWPTFLLQRLSPRAIGLFKKVACNRKRREVFSRGENKSACGKEVSRAAAGWYKTLIFFLLEEEFASRSSNAILFIHEETNS